METGPLLSTIDHLSSNPLGVKQLGQTIVLSNRKPNITGLNGVGRVGFRSDY